MRERDEDGETNELPNLNSSFILFYFILFWFMYICGLILFCTIFIYEFSEFDFLVFFVFDFLGFYDFFWVVLFCFFDKEAVRFKFMCFFIFLFFIMFFYFFKLIN